MKTLRRNLAKALAIAAPILVSSHAFAAESSHGGTYVQAHVLGYSSVATAFGSAGAFPLEFHAGYHLSGRHDGIVIGGTQKFLLGSASAGATLLRAGYDIAIPIKDYELVISPYAVGGIYYGFSGGGAYAMVGPGVEGRFFFMKEGMKGLFASAKPVELAFVTTPSVVVTYTFSVGAGLAFD